MNAGGGDEAPRLPLLMSNVELDSAERSPGALERRVETGDMDSINKRGDSQRSGSRGIPEADVSTFIPERDDVANAGERSSCDLVGYAKARMPDILQDSPPLPISL